MKLYYLLLLSLLNILLCLSDDNIFLSIYGRLFGSSSPSSSSSSSSQQPSSSSSPIILSSNNNIKKSLRYSTTKTNNNNNNNNNTIIQNHNHAEIIKNVLPSAVKQELAFKTYAELKTIKHNNRSINAAMTPTKHSYDEVLQKRTEFIVSKYGACSKLIIIGDSVLERIRKNNTLWRPLEDNYCAINLASPGDCTEHVLHRFENGKYLKNITNSPLVIIMIGTNNIVLGDSPLDVVKAVNELIKLIKANVKNVSILLYGLLPRNNPSFSKLSLTFNKYMKENIPDNVTFVDISNKYLQGDNINPKLFLSDRLHPNAMGTSILMKSIEEHTSILPKSKYVPKLTTVTKTVAAPTKSIFRNNTLSKTKLNTSHLAAGTLSITKHPPGVHQGIGEHHPNIANSRPKIHPKPIPKIQPISKEQE